MADPTHAIGQPVLRNEDHRLLTGRGQFSDDAHVPGTVYGVVVRSPHAHATLGRIDINAAAAVKGVLAVLTGADYVADGLKPIPNVPNPAHITRAGEPAFANADGTPVFQGDHWPLARDKVRHVGEPVAFVVAETAHGAEEAAELVSVTYEPLEAVTDVRRAVQSTAPQLWDNAPGNVCFDTDLGDADAVDAAMASAAHIVRLDLWNNRVTAVSMEPRAGTGIYDETSGRYTLIAGSQGSHALKRQLTGLLGCEPDRVRVVCEDVGGGYGMRNWLFPEFALVVWAAQRVRRPVKWVATRSESFLSDMQARDLATHAMLALDEDGKFLAIDVDHLSNIGGHTMSFVPLSNGVLLVSSIYDIPCAHVRARAVLTNTLSTGPYRGAGRPEAMFNMERLIDEAASRTGIDRIELRRRNLIPQDKLPYPNPVGLTYECGAFHENMATAQGLADWEGFAARRASSEAGDKRRGIGLCNYIETPVGFPREMVRVTIDPTGRVVTDVGTQNHGQGHETSFAQVVAEYLAVPFETVDIVNGDSDRLADGGGTHSNRSMRIAGTLMVQGCETIIERGRTIAAHCLEAAVDDMGYVDGVFRVTGTDRVIGLFDVAERAMGSDMPDELRGPLAAEEKFQGRIPAYPTGCAIAEVEVDPETGAVIIDRWTAVDDVGRVINPLIVEGQTHGGIAQGVGQALCEDIAYDDKTGQLHGGSFLDYCMPRADDLPSFTTQSADNAPTKGNKLGVKGGGEGGTTPALAALTNAIVDALRPLGVSDIKMPATPLRVWQAIQEARG
ncbi:MAG: xanthine dehydrogenase family protein molybdopterin-binding subunit [Rhodospirillaceae bacterium]|jgi:aerobic carbon-monoxide dehydrogenase large subunit|nr:xanthine dehydrogenase family protein molybdopterin-binding subunit [Rhodospirillaceae bacterium]